MWYLSRTPGDHPNSLLFSPRNSIFPASDTGIFEEISIVEVPQDHEPDQSQSFVCNPWEWFAYLCSPIHFHSVVVPRNPSFKIQVIAVLPDQFLCAKLGQGPHPHATLCSYSVHSNALVDVPKLDCQDWNLIGASGALLDGWLYLAGGFKGTPSYMEPSSYLTLAYRLNLKTLEWDQLPAIATPRAYATAIAYRNKFYMVGGCSETVKHSAEIYDPDSKSWQFLATFVPNGASGFAVASTSSRLVMLTWSDEQGVKLWLWVELTVPHLVGGWRVVSFFADQYIGGMTLRQHGARMVRVGKEVWIMVGESESERQVCQVDGACAWPVFPAPMFRPCDGREVVLKGHVFAFSFLDGVRLSWRQIPVYSI